MRRAAEHAWRYAELAADLGVEAHAEEPLARHTTMRVGGPAAWLFLPDTMDKAAALAHELAAGPLPIRFLGAGSNLIVVDEGVRAAVIGTRALKNAPRELGGARLEVDAGQPLPGLVRFAVERGLAGVEFGEGIPAQLGGAVRMNAGANQGWMSDVTREVLVAGPKGRVEARACSPEDFGYRTSFVAREGLFVLGARLAFVEDEVEELKARVKRYRERRRSTQPLRDSSAGCVFANYDDAKVGALVEELGLKGLGIGGAEVSEIHGNFIVNRTDARASDVLALVERVSEELTRRTGRAPRIEVEIWRDAS